MDEEECGRIEDSCMVQKTRKLVVEQKTVVWFKRRGSVWSNRGQLYGSKDDEACGRTEDSCMVQKTIKLVVELRTVVWFKIVSEYTYTKW